MLTNNMIKKFLYLCGISILLMGAFAHAQTNSTTRFFFAYDYENLTVDDTSGGVAFTSSKVTSSTATHNANAVTFTIECSDASTSCPIRMTLNGTAPTTSVGMLADYGSSITIYNHTSIVAFRAIRTGSTSAVLNIQYFN
jgi:hypothetical protein